MSRSTRSAARRASQVAIAVGAAHLLSPHGATAQSAGATAPPPLTLQQAVEEAQRKRPLLTADLARVESARARIGQARAGLLPRVDLQASATDGPTGAPPLGLGGLVGTPLKKHTGGSLNLVQTLLDFGRTQNLVRARREDTVAAQELLRADRNRVELEVRQAFLQTLEAQRLLAVNRQILEQRQLVARQAASLFRNGLTSRVDVDLAEAAVAQGQLAVVRSQSDVEVAYAALSTALGRPVATATPLEDVVPAGASEEKLLSPGGAPLATPGGAGTPPRAPKEMEPATPAPSLEDTLTRALKNRPELSRMAAQVRSFDHQTAAAKAGKRPFLNGVASVGKINPVPLFESSDKPWAVGLGLTVPIFTGGLVEGQVSEARRNAEAARGDLDELANAVRQQVTGAYANLAAAEESVRVAEVQLVRARDALALSTRRYQTQLGTIVELTQAQVTYAAAQNDFVRAQYDRQLARAALAFATGQSNQGAVPGGKQ